MICSITILDACGIGYLIGDLEIGHLGHDRGMGDLRPRLHVYTTPVAQGQDSPGGNHAPESYWL